MNVSRESGSGSHLRGGTHRQKTIIGGLKAQTHFWATRSSCLRGEREVSVKVEDAEDKSDDAQDVGPLQATRLGYPAENNVIDRL